MMLFSRRVWLLARSRQLAWGSSSLGPPLSSRSDSTDEHRHGLDVAAVDEMWHRRNSIGFLSLGKHPSHSDLTSFTLLREQRHPNKSECIRNRYALSVSAATFFKCAIAACAPVVLVRRLSVTSSSFTGVSAMSVYVRAAGSRVITSLSKKRRAIIPMMTTCLLSVCQTNRGQKMKARSRGRPGRRSEGCFSRRMPPCRGCTFSSHTVVAKLTSTLMRLLTDTPVATARRSSVSMCFGV